MPVMFTFKPDDRTELGRAVAQIPELTAVVDAAEAVRRQLAPQHPTTTPEQVIASAVVDARAGKPLDFATIGQAILDAERDTAALERGVGARRQILDGLLGEAQFLVETNVDIALEALAASLDEVLDLARAADRTLGSLTTDVDILRAGAAQVDAWRQLDTLATRYAAIRAGQLRLVALVWDQETYGETLRRFGWLRGADLIWSRHDLPEMPPWPHQDNGTTPEQPLIGPALLRWLASYPGADPWLPTIEQLRQEQHDAGQRQEAREFVPRGSGLTGPARIDAARGTERHRLTNT